MKLLALNSCAVQKAWGLMLALSLVNSVKGRPLRFCELHGQGNGTAGAKQNPLQCSFMVRQLSEKS